MMNEVGQMGYDKFYQLGKGRMGKVFGATDRFSQLKVAIKEIPAGDDQGFQGSQRRNPDFSNLEVNNLNNCLGKYVYAEIKIHSLLCDHPNIIKLYDWFYVQPIGGKAKVYLVLKYAEAGDLARISENGLPEDRARQIFRDVVEGVQHLHSNNIAHRDLKLESILVTENWRGELADFGLSVYSPSKSIATGPVAGTYCGTPGYMAPEVGYGPYDPFKADIWSLGVILYKMVTGCFPSSYQSIKLAIKHPLIRPELRTLFTGLFSRPEFRLSIEQVRLDPWLNSPSHLFKRLKSSQVRKYLSQVTQFSSKYFRQVKTADKFFG